MATDLKTIIELIEKRKKGEKSESCCDELCLKVYLLNPFGDLNGDYVYYCVICGELGNKIPDHAIDMSNMALHITGGIYEDELPSYANQIEEFLNKVYLEKGNISLFEVREELIKYILKEGLEKHDKVLKDIVEAQKQGLSYDKYIRTRKKN